MVHVDVVIEFNINGFWLLTGKAWLSSRRIQERAFDILTQLTDGFTTTVQGAKCTVHNLQKNTSLFEFLQVQVQATLFVPVGRLAYWL